MLSTLVALEAVLKPQLEPEANELVAVLTDATDGRGLKLGFLTGGTACCCTKDNA